MADIARLRAILCTGLLLAITQQSHAAGSVIINEVMANNKGAAEFGPEVSKAIEQAEPQQDNPDWVELRNAAQSPVNLKGWQLRAHGVNVTLPDVSLQPDGLLLLIAEGKSTHRRTALATKHSAVEATVMTTAFSGPAPVLLGAPFSLPASSKQLMQLAVLQPDGQVSDTLGWVPSQHANLSWGYPGPGTAKQAGLPDQSGCTYLATPTPGQSNSAPLKEGPFIINVTHKLASPAMPGQPIQIDIGVVPNLSPIQIVTLICRVGFAAEQTVSATLKQPAPSPPPGAAPGFAVYTASIPSSAFKAGDLVRWAAKAVDTASLTSRNPRTGPTQTPGAAAKGPPQWYGTVVGGVQDPDITPNGVPVLDWCTEQPQQSTTVQGAGGSVLYFNNSLYDGVFIHRRGVSSLAWPKPKLKVEMAQGQLFKYSPDAPGVKEFGLQSHFYELGERSYMKESLGLQLLADAGVPTPTTFYVHVRLNGNFYGLFSFVESVDDTFLKRNKIRLGGPLYKSENGELSNLRWDIQPRDMPNFWSLKYPRDQKNLTSTDAKYRASSEWVNLQSFTRGLAGGGAVKRSAFVMESLYIPEVIDLLAAQVIINNQDRCTKNFFMYQDPETLRWYMLPWDLDGALGQDNGLGGAPGDKYCVLACEQWNSPLYCDSEHTQDLQRVTPWGVVTVKMDDPYTGGNAAAAGGQVPMPTGGRRALLQTSYMQFNPTPPPATPSSPAPAPSTTATGAATGAAVPPGAAPMQPPAGVPAASSTAATTPTTAAAATAPSAAATPATSVAQQAAKPATRPPTEIERLLVIRNSYPKPQGWDNPDVDRTQGASPLGAAGTYNHLVDAITDVANTRAMLMRRIRTLADVYLGSNGKLVQMANETYTRIRSLAVRDAAAWKSGINIDRGYQQIVKEYAPVRQYILLDVYGPNGSDPLIPAAQPPASTGLLQITKMVPAAPGSNNISSVSHIEVLNLSSTNAVDISGWSLEGPDSTFHFKPGTVIPPSTTLYVASDLTGFDKAHTGQGLFVTGPLKKRKADKGSLNAIASARPRPTNMQLLDASGQLISQM